MKIKKIVPMKLLIIFLIIFGLNIFFIVPIKKVKAFHNVKFNNYTIEHGLPQASAETIIQDEKGYIWIGTNDGLARYNGYGFKVFRNEIENENSIIGNYIINLNIDKKNNLWVATTNGLSRINLNTYEICNYNEEEGFKNINITYVLVTKNNNILVSTSDGIYIYDEEEDKFTRVTYKNTNSALNNIYCIAEDSAGAIWIGNTYGINKVLIDYESKSGELIYKKCVSNGILDLYHDGKVIYAGSYEEGLYCINTETFEYSIINKKNSGIPSNTIQRVLKDSNGFLWIGTKEGLVKLDLLSKGKNIYVNSPYDNHSLVNNDIYSIFEDKSGLIWVGTYGGISKLSSDKNIEHYRVDPEKEFSITDNMIHGIYEDDNGCIWLGTNQKGLNILDRKNEKVYEINAESEGINLICNSVTDVKGFKNFIFVGTNEGLSIIDAKNKTSVSYDEKNGLNPKKIKSLFVDSLGNLLIGTSDGLYIMNIETRKIKSLNGFFDENGIKDRYIECIYEDKQGNYWIGTFLTGGLIKLNPSNGTFVNYKTQKGKNSISSNSIRVITQDNDGYLWIGTSGGLNKLNIDTEVFENYTTLNGLPNNTVYGILFDSNDNLWASTNNGITKFDKVNKNFENLSINDGLQSNEFNGAAYFKNKCGEMMFAGINGLNIFKPENIFNESFISQVQFDELKLNGVNVENLNNKTLSYDQNTIFVKLFMADYKNVDNIKYYYSLRKDGDKWTMMDTNEITLSNLSPGHYTFRVKAKNSVGTYSEENSFEFEIKPPFFRSKLAFVIYLSFIIIVIAVILYLKNKKMYHLNEMVKDRTKDLNKEMNKNIDLLNKVIKLEKNKNAYLVNISHELRTPLNVLSSIEQVIRELNKSNDGIPREKLDHYMNITKINVSRLLKLINDLIDSSKIEYGNYHLNIEKNDIVFIVEETALSLKDYIESMEIELIIDPQIEECIIECDKSEIERCIINLVNNAVKFTNPGGRILVSMEEYETEVKISVSDNGIGIKEEDLELIFNRFSQVVDNNGRNKKGSGLGLTITRLIVNLHKGSIYVSSKVNEGSTFNIILPKEFTHS